MFISDLGAPGLARFFLPAEWQRMYHLDLAVHCANTLLVSVMFPSHLLCVVDGSLHPHRKNGLKMQNIS